ncbi:MAG: alpha/beta fold hydrolase [Candidatus Sericytochromatia bacterium]|nr:alpha/beta fold hydrolase [Candidatus Sericytochromatia bacterium]
MLELASHVNLPPTAYQRGVAALRQFQAAERQVPLQRGSETRAWLHPDKPPRGTLVMYHGFTAGTWQYEHLAPLAFQAGFNVFVPRLPGHGVKSPSGDEDPGQLPRSTQWEAYRHFGDRTLGIARQLGGPVSVLGLSVGGNVALDVAERHREVRCTVAYAPFLWPRHERVDRLFRLVGAFDFLFADRAGPSLDGFTHSWGPECRQETISGQRPGHSYFPASAVYAAARYGTDVIRASARGQSVLQVFVTAADDAADEAAIRTLFANWGNSSRGLYRYSASEGIPHPMVHPREDRGRGHTSRLYALTMGVLQGETPLQRDEP